MSPPEVRSYFWLLLVIFGVAMVARRLRVPYAIALVVAGLALGAPHLLPHVHLDPGLLFGVLLPPLLFESAITLRNGSLLRDWKPIAVYALAGTALSALVVGGLTAWVLGIPLPAGLAFGALISATDPISVLAIFRRLGADRRLTLIVEAESLFNDGIAVVLFTVAMAAVAGPESVSPAGSVWMFVWTVAGGAALGSAVGWLGSRVHFELDDHLVEITLTTVVAYGAYLAADALHVSGVVAVVAAGMVIGNHAIPKSMSPGTQVAVASFWEYAAFLVNSIVFLLIGIEAALLNWWNTLGFTIGAVAAVLLGRASVYPLSFLVNRIGGRVPRPWQHVLFWGGLRGALSMALVLGLPPAFPRRDVLVAGTFGVVLFSLLAQGLTIGPLLRRLGLCRAPAGESEYARIAGEILVTHAALGELNRLIASETYPNWAIKSLADKYGARLDELERAGRAHAETGGPAAEHELAVERRALIAQKNLLTEAERRGWLEEEEWRALTARIDAELVELLERERAHPSREGAGLPSRPPADAGEGQLPPTG